MDISPGHVHDPEMIRCGRGLYNSARRMHTFYLYENELHFRGVMYGCSAPAFVSLFFFFFFLLWGTRTIAYLRTLRIFCTPVGVRHTQPQPTPSRWPVGLWVWWLSIQKRWGKPVLGLYSTSPVNYARNKKLLNIGMAWSFLPRVMSTRGTCETN